MTTNISYIAPDGYKYREVAEHPFEDDTDDRVGVIITDRYKRILVVRGETGKYSLPKGCRHRGETEWEGALREVWEETGLDLEKEESVAYEKNKVILGHGVYFKFRLKKSSMNVQIRIHHDEYEKIKEVLWIRLENLQRYYKECNSDLKVYIRGQMKLLINRNK